MLRVPSTIANTDEWTADMLDPTTDPNAFDCGTAANSSLRTSVVHRAAGGDGFATLGGTPFARLCGAQFACIGSVFTAGISGRLRDRGRVRPIGPTFRAMIGDGE